MGQAILMDEETTLVLSLDFSHRLHPGVVSNASVTAHGRQIAPQIITSLSSGSLARLEMDESGQYEIADKWHAHDFEPWCATWDNWDLNTVWSGESSCDLCGCVVLNSRRRRSQAEAVGCAGYLRPDFGE